ncbi:hypothetical protein [Propionimicrobium lymphophilum]|uniref:Uncharacterized protein n=1 Tax=Propionimicrobium lymphophilum ACS-093-V-SCH5 TaxID=883161 RepID=S2W1K1_9ACTN|nr:hypothetical protein [Propionimicrobium lymphophilum]EPD33041.1 hypothetical protein HMPREF9306_00570 [Propionimicrobium lymphophilum ACS-093-V-SCH5]
MPQVRAEVNFGMLTDWEGGEFAPIERREAEIEAMLSELEGLLK